MMNNDRICHYKIIYCNEYFKQLSSLQISKIERCVLSNNFNEKNSKTQD